MLPSLSPSAGSYTYPQIPQTYFSIFPYPFYFYWMINIKKRWKLPLAGDIRLRFRRLSLTFIDKKIVLYYKAQLESAFLISALDIFSKIFSQGNVEDDGWLLENCILLEIRRSTTPQ
jgi:hypothetical protein